LVNFGIIPLRFTRPADYDSVQQGDELEMSDVRAAIAAGRPVVVRNKTKKVEYQLAPKLSPRQIRMLLAGGLTHYLKEKWAAGGTVGR
jgi:aconitase A